MADTLPLNEHLEAEAWLSKRCAAMRRLIKAHGPCQLKPHPRRSPYEALVSAVAHQQLHANAAQAILKRFHALFPRGRFPKPAALLATNADALRAAGFSHGKIASILDIAAKTESGVIPSRAAASRLSDEELIARLVEVRGVGRWTVEMLLIFTLGRKDVFPADDYGVRAGFRSVMKHEDLPRPRDLREQSERWKPHRTVAAWYLWRAADAAK
jgi:DNA-3-methyladenine glycosylase II